MSSQIERYLSYIDILELSVSQDEENNALIIKLNYSIPSIGVRDTEEVRISGLARNQTNIPF